MAMKSPGKDSTTGHWELAGVVLDKPFATFPAEPPSFPRELVDELERASGRGMLGNYAASGTEIIRVLGDEHLASGDLILYTSADSVLQIAAHDAVMTAEGLYAICESARRIADRYNISRVIARPFTGERGSFVRTDGRRDFSIDLPGPSVLDALLEADVATVGIGKIGDLFNRRGLSEDIHAKGNPACLDALAERLQRVDERNAFIFVNLVDTDMLYGHRRDVAGYYRCLAYTDAAIAGVIDQLRDDDLLVISADHGCDPAYPGTDHTREYVPLLVYGSQRPSRNLGVRTTLSDCAQSLAAFFGIDPMPRGASFL
jgi:phosphopentomutase